MPGFNQGELLQAMRRQTSRAALQLKTRTTEIETEHSEDFTSIIWFGIRYEFNKTQAECVKLLWAEWEKGGLGLSEKTIGDKIGSANNRYRLAHTFRPKEGGSHPTWRTMIQSVRKGIFALRAPGSPIAPHFALILPRIKCVSTS